ncbi:MAG: GGDEF domain-containing protein [Candidatus Brocadiia bacterium]
MENAPIRILMVEDSAPYALALKDYLSAASSERVEVVHVETMATARPHLLEGAFDAVLLDLSLPDSRGLATVEQATSLNPRLPIIVLTGLADEAIGTEAVRKGAQDYLVKGNADGALLVRAIRYAVERKRAEESIRALSLEDELTGLLNRRGFYALAEQQLKVARRTKTGLFLLFADVDGLKTTNDRFGHAEGDRLIRDAARILRATFRDSDIVARIGGDEFVVLMIQTDESAPAQFLARLAVEIEKRNAGEKESPLSLSTGVTRYGREAPVPLDELIRRADALMYEEKRKKRSQ